MSWKLGIDTAFEIFESEVECEYEFLKKNLGPDKSMRGGPTCSFRGKNIPCFVGASPNASITSNLLMQMLKHMDNQGLWRQEDKSESVFLLLDGHHSPL